MNILHINEIDNAGGAAKAMIRLHLQFFYLGHRSNLLVRRKRNSEPYNFSISHECRPFRTLSDRLLDRLGRYMEKCLAVDRWSHRNTFHLHEIEPFRQADVINLHNIRPNYFNLRALPLLASHKPIFWTLHDMWALTGHCAYSYDCERWKTGCFHCPLFRGQGRKKVEPPPTRWDRTRAQWNIKRNAYARAKLYFIAPSKWLWESVCEAFPRAGDRIRWIPYGVDLETFKPLDRKAARSLLGLPKRCRVLFFSAERLGHPRKGLNYLLKALAKVPKKDRLCLLLSGKGEEVVKGMEGVCVRHLGYLKDERLQRLAFSASDLFVCPSLADNQPLTVLEALACGTPVVAFDVGGVPDMVRHLETGYLASYRDVDDLARGIQHLLSDDTLRYEMKRRCREVAEKEYSLEVQASRYVAFYEQALESFRTSRKGLITDAMAET